jgi:hypothetical protein
MPKVNTRSNKFFPDTRSGKYYVNNSGSNFGGNGAQLLDAFIWLKALKK